VRTLVIGSAGYVGRRVMVALRDRGLDPIGVDIVAVPGVVDETLDLTDSAEIGPTLRRLRPDVILNLSYLLTSASNEGPLRAVEVNISGITALFDAAAKLDIDRVVYASSGAVYGDQSEYGDATVDEDTPPSPRTLYGHMKHFNEVIASRYSAMGDTRFVSLRLSSVHGCDKGGLFSPFDTVVRASRESKEVTLPWPADHEFAFVHVDDVAAAFGALAQGARPNHEIYNTGGEHMTMKRLAEAAEPLTGLRIQFEEPGSRVPQVSRVSRQRLQAEFELSFGGVADWLPAELDRDRKD
jgi:nucleoside-diphosphate-sugar epimerase